MGSFLKFGGMTLFLILVLTRAGRKTRSSLTRSTRLDSGSTRLDSFIICNELSLYFNSLR
jgi:hypothetical protein